MTNKQMRTQLIVSAFLCCVCAIFVPPMMIGWLYCFIRVLGIPNDDKEYRG
jgi:hypothetical protein